ncbi:methylglyoxal synthase [Candidatus Cryosericum septentrionale]|jgi:methylglyoxal synthase|uniref:Methylglyoxal synthase n=1 Tax=Candidatus Cryosericum septentrionale TaxID=2290913 RepID=A0A398DR05_9BACT|nr:methylglyoxal synthase [Candidatus Cryosericum septentrionale]RIE16459.1 methylglyoxal synthase [Candidatus Cryosericum septentrionale]
MRTRVALIAHDRKKPEMIALCRDFQEMLAQEELVATKSTGGLIEELTGLHVTRVNSGEKGGDLQIGSMIASDEIKAVVFLRDPLTAHPHEPDINAVLKICDVNNIPLATNIATARLVLGHLKELQSVEESPTA